MWLSWSTVWLKFQGTTFGCALCSFSWRPAYAASDYVIREATYTTAQKRLRYLFELVGEHVKSAQGHYCRPHASL